MAKTDPEIIFLFRFDILQIPFDLVNVDQNNWDFNIFFSNYEPTTRIKPSSKLIVAL